nr:unnamed protein product [Spirometra erinaceieuropaei]
MVLTELLRLKESKSPDPDEIPAKILKEIAGELSKPLSMLFHTSFETGYLPPHWKSAWITPLYKGGSRVSANNYRPVSLTSICCKIMEKIIKQQLMQFLEQNHLLSDSQHGFRKGRSCVTNLLYCLEHWTRAIDRGDMVHAIYIDFKKASIVCLTTAFYINLAVQNSEVAVRSGVPQGSVLGPTLFLVYVNDCANELNCDVAMFVDDIKIWSTIQSEVDEARLQTNLDHLEQWSKDWLLPLNVNKCTFLRVGRTSSPNHTVYRLTGKPLQEDDAQKDLGAWITTSLKPSLQCSKVAKSAMSMLYLVKRAFSSFDEDCFAKTKTQTARSMLDVHKTIENNEGDNPRSNRPERRTALVARELARYKVDIAALSETRFSEQGQLEEVGADYTFIWSGRLRTERRDAGVAFAIRNDIMGRLPCLPQGINDRLMSLRLPLWEANSPPSSALRSDDDQPRRLQSTALAVLGRAPRQHQDLFDGNDAAIRNLLAEKNRLHKAYADHLTDATKAAFYRSRRQLQQRLREMQDAWTARKAEAVYGPPTKGTSPLLSADGNTLLTEKTQILQRWAEHFQGVLNRPSVISDAAIERLPQVETNADLDFPPSLQETIRAVLQLSSGKAPGSDAIPAEVYKHGGPRLM